MRRDGLCRAGLAAALLVGLLGYWTGTLWAGGNTQFRHPSNPSQVIDKRWDERMLPIPWVLSQDGLPGSGIDNATLIAELTAAFDTWEAIATSRLAFAFGGEVPIRETGEEGPLGAGIDGRNLITFTDPDVIFPPGVLAVTITFAFAEETVITAANNDLDGDGTPDIPTGTYAAGTIFDGDIAFNSSEPWSVSGANGSRDIRAVALHEIGHFFGLAHSMIRDAVMWPFLAADITAARTPKADDIAYASFFYPDEPAFSAAFGAIRGNITNGFNGAPILGAHVFTVDPLSGERLVGAYSGDDGSYVIPGLATGSYLVAIEPLDGDPIGLDPFRINQVIQFTFDTNFPEEFYDTNEANVEADALAGAPVEVVAGGDTIGIDLVTNTVQVPGVNVLLSRDYNLFAYPVQVPAALRAFDVLQALGDSTEVNAMDRFVPGTSTFERAEYVDGVPTGVNFPIRRGEGYVVHMDAEQVVSFTGGTDCPPLELTRGLNLVGIPCPPAGYTAFTLLEDLGTPFEVAGIERFDAETGSFQRVQYDDSGTPSGDDFPISNGEGYLVNMRADKAGVRVPAVGRRFAPVLTGLSPGRGVPGTIVVLLGDGFEPDVTQNAVSFNGVGAGIIFATATSLTVTVPATATTGPVRVTVGTQQSNAIEFVVEAPSLSETAASNVQLVSGQTVQGDLSADGEQDRYQFTALAGSLVTVTAEAVTPGVPDLVLLLEDPFGVIVATDDNSGSGANPRLNNFELQQTGTHTIVVSNVPGSGTGAYRLSLSLTTRSAPTQVSILEGNFQTSVAGSTLPVPLSIFVTGPTGAPVAGVPVTFVAEEVALGGSAATPTTAGTVVLATNDSGIVTVQTTLPGLPGNYTIKVTVPGAATATFVIAATNTAVASITMNGNLQTGTVGQPLANPLEVVLQDSSGSPVVGGLVAFLVVGGDGSVAPFGALNTDAAGKAGTTFTLGTKTSDPQIVAAVVPGRAQPLLFEAIPEADAPAKVRSNRSNFNRLTLGTSVLNALQISVFDQFDNPVQGATVNYTGPDGLSIDPGLGPNGELFTDFTTNPDGLHVAMVTADLDATPSVDEFGNQDDENLASTYSITATVAGGGALSVDYSVDVDMGPTMVTASAQGAEALIGQSLPNPVVKQVLRFERVDGDDDDDDFRNEDFSRVTEKAVDGETVNFEVRREDGKKENAFGLQPTRTSATSVPTDANGFASVEVTMGDVGGAVDVVGKMGLVVITWVFEGPEVVVAAFENITEASKLLAVPVVITVFLDDAGSGIDFRTVQASLNGTAFFNAASPPAVLPEFPEKLEIIAGGAMLKTLNADILDKSAFKSITINYHPSAPKLQTGNNTVEVQVVKDKVKNVQASTRTHNFTFP